MRQHDIASFLAVVSLFAGCSSENEPGPPPQPGDQPSSPTGPCGVVTQSFSIVSARHVSECTPLPDEPRPPAGGDHYSSWAAFQSYDFPIARGFLIHALEHGAIVFTYNCPEGCADEVAEVRALIDAQPPDPLCYGTTTSDGSPIEQRAVLAPDPTLDVRWGVSAWGYTLRASCVDSAAFTQFYSDHYGKSPENLCNPGIAFTTSPCQ